MNFEHDLRGLFTRPAKKTLYDIDNEFHRRVIVIQQNDLVHRWRLRFRRSSL
jgi:hypothetical protein